MSKKTKKRAAKKPSTALALRHKTLPVAAAKVQVLDTPRTQLTSDISLGELGLVEVKLKPEEEEVLARNVNTAHILIKPQQVPVPYLPHPVYTRWFNEAFGRLGWALVPASKPMLQGTSVVQPFVLHIHGQPAAFAMGEQEFHANNKDQTYGDALEATVASALRRCAKRLGVGLQMWDRGFLQDFIERQCVCVKVKTKDGEEKRQWRRRDEKRFYNEVGNERAREERREDTGAGIEPPHEVRHKDVGEPITQPQRKRLWAIMKGAGRSEDEMRGWLKRKYGLDSTAGILRKDYDAICKAVEAPGVLAEQ